MPSVGEKPVVASEDSADPAPFSVASAQLAIEELFQAIPKSRRLEHLGAYNEAMWVLTEIAGQGEAGR